MIPLMKFKMCLDKRNVKSIVADEGTKEVGEDWKTLRWYTRVKTFENGWHQLYFNGRTMVEEISFFMFMQKLILSTYKLILLVQKLKFFVYFYLKIIRKRKSAMVLQAIKSFFFQKNLYSSDQKGFISGLIKASIVFKANGCNLISSIMIASM